MTNQTTITNIFDDDLDSFVKELTDKLDTHTRTNYKNLTPDPVTISVGGKWVKVFHGRSVYAFIAMTDFSNKQLGQVNKGDIHKPASYKQPAKHARGSIYSTDRLDCCGPYGVQYLRG